MPNVFDQFDKGNVFDQFDTPSKSQPESRSFLGDLGHQAGLAVRAGVNGIAALPEMAADAVTAPINAGLDVVAGKGNGFRFQRSGEALNNLMTAAGLPVPENAKERVVQDIASNMVGAGAMAGAGRLLAKSGGAVAAGVGNVLSAGPGLQVASAGAGSGASGVVRENGGGEGAQLAAGLVGSLVPVGAFATRVSKGAPQQAIDAANKAHTNGYVIPPADLEPSVLTEIASGIGGKIKTAQVASQKNQSTTNGLVKKAFGLGEDAELTNDVLADIRKEAGKAYEAVAATGQVTPSQSYADALDAAVQPYLNQAKSFPNRKTPTLVDEIQAFKTDKFDAGDAIDSIRVLRNDADIAYRAGDNMAGKAYKSASKALEGAIDDHLVSIGAPADLLDSYRDARQTIAQTYTVQKALNSQTGNVNAQKLASELTKGTPLTDELKTVAEISQAFPRATQALKESPKNVDVLDVATAFIKEGLKAKLGLLGARPLARTALFSDFVQNRAVDGMGGVNALAGAPASAIEASMRANGYDHINQPKTNPVSAISRAPTVDSAIALANSALPDVQVQESHEDAPSRVSSSSQNADGTYVIKGNTDEIMRELIEAGLPPASLMPMTNGVLVGKSQALMVQEAFDQSTR